MKLEWGEDSAADSSLGKKRLGPPPADNVLCPMERRPKTPVWNRVRGCGESEGHAVKGDTLTEAFLNLMWGGNGAKWGERQTGHGRSGRGGMGRETGSITPPPPPLIPHDDGQLSKGEIQPLLNPCFGCTSFYFSLCLSTPMFTCAGGGEGEKMWGLLFFFVCSVQCLHARGRKMWGPPLGRPPHEEERGRRVLVTPPRRRRSPAPRRQWGLLLRGRGAGPGGGGVE